ncbi:MAG: hypothetical protein HZB38_00430 [Planctomycetes bacterium]|nr:hypothetical protein [Planctomycetota bacterium]
MFRSGRFAIVVAGLFSIAAPGFAQTQPAAPSDSARVLAGVREYPDAVVEAMVTLARHPDWLDKAAEQAKSKAGVNAGDPAAPDNIRQALRTLAPLPEAILLAAARRDELNILRDLRVEAPQGADVRLRQLRTDYATARREGALRWQQALQENKGALDAYRELLTRFSQKMREQIPNFAVVEVTDAAYYHVLPPDEILMGFGQQEKAPEQLWKVMTEWYDRFGADRVDEQALNAGEPVSASRAENALIDGPAESRKGMFRAGDGKGSGSVGLIPVAIQPLADQPNEARLAYAIAEHERLWSAPADRQVAEPNAAAGMEAQDMAAAPVDDAEVLIEPPLEDGQVSDVVVTPARPDMIIPPAGLVRPADEPIVIASAYDDDVLFDGGATGLRRCRSTRASRAYMTFLRRTMCRRLRASGSASDIRATEGTIPGRRTGRFITAIRPTRAPMCTPTIRDSATIACMCARITTAGGLGLGFISDMTRIGGSITRRTAAAFTSKADAIGAAMFIAGIRIAEVASRSTRATAGATVGATAGARILARAARATAGELRSAATMECKSGAAARRDRR